MAVDHYENFPVASFLLPARLRPAVEAIYAFARSADDLADEGDAESAERLAALSVYAQELHRIEAGQPASDPMFAALAEVMRDFQLPALPFHDLLSAFRQDIVTTRYQTIGDLLDYCRRSANPVGVLMLYLYDAASTENLRDANAICSALQLINFCQDVAVDWQKQRIYLPLDEMQRFGVTEQHIAGADCSAAWQSLMRHQTGRARAMMLSGAPLARRLPGRIGWELRAVIQGGLRILERIEQSGGDVFRQRPTLKLRDWTIMAWRALNMRG